MSLIVPEILYENILAENSPDTNQDNSSGDRTTIGGCLDWFDYSYFTVSENNYVEFMADSRAFDAVGFYVDFPEGSSQTFDLVMYVETAIGSGVFSVNYSSLGIDYKLGLWKWGGGLGVNGRRVRLAFENISGSPAQIRLRQIAVGRLLRPPFGQRASMLRPSFPGDAKFTQKSTVNGSFVGRDLLRSSKEDSFTWNLVDSGSWLRDDWAPFVEAANRHAFFYSWWPTQYPRETIFAMATKIPRPREMQYPGKAEVSVTYLGLAENY